MDEDKKGSESRQSGKIRLLSSGKINKRSSGMAKMRKSSQHRDSSNAKDKSFSDIQRFSVQSSSKSRLDRILSNKFSVSRDSRNKAQKICKTQLPMEEPSILMPMKKAYGEDGLDKINSLRRPSTQSTINIALQHQSSNNTNTLIINQQNAAKESDDVSYSNKNYLESMAIRNRYYKKTVLNRGRSDKKMNINVKDFLDSFLQEPIRSKSLCRKQKRNQVKMSTVPITQF